MGIDATILEPFGCAVHGLDLEQDLDPATSRQLRALWAEHGILIVRGGGTSPEAHLRLSRCFGALEPSATAKLNLAANPYLMALNQDETTPINIYEVGGMRRSGWLGWHWDQAFMPQIVRGAVLRMIEPSSIAGETGFIHGGQAYERLSSGFKRRVADLEVVYHFAGDQECNRFGFPPDLRLVERSPEQSDMIARYRREFPPVVHPLLISPPETGRKILKLSPMHARAVLGMGPDDSDALLAELARHLVDERYAYFHRWEANDMIVWDNWSVIHSARSVTPGTIRRAQRTTIVGDYKLGRYLDPMTDRSRYQLRIAD